MCENAIESAFPGLQLYKYFPIPREIAASYI